MTTGESQNVDQPKNLGVFGLSLSSLQKTALITTDTILTYLPISSSIRPSLGKIWSARSTPSSSDLIVTWPLMGHFRLGSSVTLTWWGKTSPWVSATVDFWLFTCVHLQVFILTGLWLSTISCCWCRCLYLGSPLVCLYLERCMPCTIRYLPATCPNTHTHTRRDTQTHINAI